MMFQRSKVIVNENSRKTHEKSGHWCEEVWWWCRESLLMIVEKVCRSLSKFVEVCRSLSKFVDEVCRSLSKLSRSCRSCRSCREVVDDVEKMLLMI
jgi:hypothetical protein